MIILEENFKWHLEAIASELFIHLLVAFQTWWACLHSYVIYIIILNQRTSYTNRGWPMKF